MKRSEAILKYHDEIKETMINRYRTVLECDGRIQYKVYVWEDGEIECLEGAQGDNSWLQAKDAEPRELFYVCTIDNPYFNPLDYSDHAAPDNEEEREVEKREIIDYLIREYEENITDKIDYIIEDAEQDESFEY